jgi:aspartate kinase
MRILIQKFGGTSVATPELREQAVGHVIKAVQEGFSPVVVVSAMGRAGDPYATDTFIKIAQSGCQDPNPREMDLLVSCGEIISAVVMANTLKAHGYDATVLTGAQAGILTDDCFTNATIKRVEPESILKHLRAGRIVIVAGFQGAAETGEITTLGRGGSDTTAAALGVALAAERIDIFTDVEGIKTADPRIVPEARTLPVITYDEICQMAHEGAKVIHPRAVEIAMRRNIPLQIRSTTSDQPGTMITYNYQSQDIWGQQGHERVVTGVTQIPEMAQLKVFTPAPVADDTEVRLFQNLAEVGISLDMITVLPEVKIFIIKEELMGKAQDVLADLELAYQAERNCAKVSVVGSGMRGVPGVMARVVTALHAAGVQIRHSTDSHVTISCLVKQDEMVAAVRAVHGAFDLGGNGL